MVAPNSPSARAQVSAAPHGQAGRDHRQRHREEHPHRRGAQRGRCLLVGGAQSSQRALQADHQERHRHEGRRHHGSRGVERQYDPEGRLQPRPQQPPAAEPQQQRDAAHGGRQHHRQQHQRAHQRLAREADPGQQPRQRHAQQQRERQRAEGDQQREPQRLGDAVAGQMGAEVAPLRTREDAQQWHQQERDRQQRGDGERHGRAGTRLAGRVRAVGPASAAGAVGSARAAKVVWAAGAVGVACFLRLAQAHRRTGRVRGVWGGASGRAAHGFWKPDLRSIFWALGVLSHFTNEAASLLCLDCLSVAAG